VPEVLGPWSCDHPDGAVSCDRRPRVPGLNGPGTLSRPARRDVGSSTEVETKQALGSNVRRPPSSPQRHPPAAPRGSGRTSQVCLRTPHPTWDARRPAWSPGLRLVPASQEWGEPAAGRAGSVTAGGDFSLPRESRLPSGRWHEKSRLAPTSTATLEPTRGSRVWGTRDLGWAIPQARAHGVLPPGAIDSTRTARRAKTPKPAGVSGPRRASLLSRYGPGGAVSGVSGNERPAMPVPGGPVEQRGARPVGAESPT
jgi:hypothetical protein